MQYIFSEREYKDSLRGVEAYNTLNELNDAAREWICKHGTCIKEQGLFCNTCPYVNMLIKSPSGNTVCIAGRSTIVKD